jgi:two-component sensor histidine kinase
MLVREMSHRVKNAFAVMSGMVAMSARTATTPEAMARDVQARLASLTRAHDLTRPGLLDSESKPGQSMTFHALVHAIFAPFSNRKSRQNVNV